MNKSAVAILSSLLFAASIAAESPPVPEAKGRACLEGPVSQFGRYIGDWKIEDEVLAQDGSGWGPGKGARWKFKCIGDGLAVQDYWYPNTGGFGTNLRTYNPDTDSWEIVWAAQKQNGLMHISAQLNDEGNVVMNVLSPVPPQPRRIIFFKPDENGWNWAMQWQLNGSSTWTDVYRIKATRWVDEEDES